MVNRDVENNGLSGLSNISADNRYYYKGGSYDYADKEFRGFSLVDEIKPNISIIRHSFHQTDGLKGKEFKTEILNDISKHFMVNEFEWGEAPQNGYYIVKLNREKNQLYDGYYTVPKTTETAYYYDSYNNPNLIHSLGDNSTQGDEKYEYFDYVYNTTAWIVNKQKSYKLYGADNSTLFTETRNYYDSKSYGSSPTKGDLTKEEMLISGSDYASNLYEYNSYGNMVKETDPNGYNVSYDYYIVDLTYTFPNRIINQKNQTAYRFYDLGTGNTLSEMDINGYLTNYTYDVFGRLLKMVKPYDSINNPTKNYSYSLDGIAPEIIKVSHREGNGTTDTFDEYYSYDGLGNLIQIKKEAENSQQIVTDIYHDGDKRVIRQSNPYFVSSSDSYSTPQGIASTVYDYDALSRVIKVTNPDNTKKNNTFNHWKVTSFDENGNKKMYYTDAYEQVKKVIEYVGNNYYTTSYAHDSAGNLKEVNDSYGQTIAKYSYDLLGRKIQENNSDLGLWTYEYDKSGNLKKQTDNLGSNTTLQYDGLNRLTLKNSSNNLINYSYDLTLNGTLSRMFSTNLTTDYIYDARLRKVLQNQTIDGKSISYNYSANGQIKTLGNVLNNVAYNSLNKPLSLGYSNGLITNLTYESESFKVTKLKTGSKQEIDYSYDSKRNVIGIRDVLDNVYSGFLYDKLDRLVFSNKTNTVALFNYTYDATGKIITVLGDNATYYYGSTPLHAPKRIVALAYSLPTGTTILHPNGGEVFNLSNLITINWTAATDQANNQLTYDLQYSNDSVTWYNIIQNYGNEYRFNDTTTQKTLVFSGNQNKTVYLRIPKKAKVNSATLNVAGQGTL